jgi:hypothetical protein
MRSDFRRVFIDHASEYGRNACGAHEILAPKVLRPHCSLTGQEHILTGDVLVGPNSSKEHSMSSQLKASIVVFVHGRWADGSSFANVIPALQRAGHEVLDGTPARQSGLMIFERSR